MDTSLELNTQHFTLFYMLVLRGIHPKANVATLPPLLLPHSSFFNLTYSRFPSPGRLACLGERHKLD